MTEEKDPVLVTGANGGIGRATVLEFSKKGWVVIGGDRDALTYDFPEGGLFVQADISRPENVAALFELVSA